MFYFNARKKVQNPLDAGLQESVETLFANEPCENEENLCFTS